MEWQHKVNFLMYFINFSLVVHARDKKKFVFFNGIHFEQIEIASIKISPSLPLSFMNWARNVTSNMTNRAICSIFSC